MARDSKATTPSEIFKEEFNNHFEKVEANRHEPEHKREEIIDWIPDRWDDPIASEAGEWLTKPLTVSKVMREWKLSDGAPGNDSVTIKMIRNSNVIIRMEMAGKIVELSEKEPSKWHATLHAGIVVPLFKMGERKMLGNYRRICLLRMASVIIPRVLATRLRTWSERLDLIGDTQHGFRAGSQQQMRHKSLYASMKNSEETKA